VSLNVLVQIADSPFDVFQFILYWIYAPLNGRVLHNDLTIAGLCKKALASFVASAWIVKKRSGNRVSISAI
jgi:hypothetical protein